MHFYTHGMRIRLLITVRKCQKTFEDNEMKIVTPNYYKDFKCIADKCSDTCCAGWDVDVDEQSYEFYKKQTGEIGERLENVMVPKEELIYISGRVDSYADMRKRKKIPFEKKDEAS